MAPPSQLVAQKYQAAKASGALSFSPTETSVVQIAGGAKFQLRYCPTLGKKPVANRDDEDKHATSPKAEPDPRPDPFIKPARDLLVTHIPSEEQPTHIVVLNKFPIIEEHFILATFENKPQSFELDAEDLHEARRCIAEWEDQSDRKLFAFYNSGPDSGASQPHRHLQFLPVDKMRDGLNEAAWSILLDQSLAGQILPVDIVVSDTPSWPCEPTTLLLQLEDLLSRARAAAVAQGFREYSTGPFSYNFAMTSTKMAVCLRTNGEVTLRDESGHEVGMLSINGTILAGTLLTKSKEAYELLKTKAAALEDVLRAIGTSSSTKKQSPGFVKL